MITITIRNCCVVPNVHAIKKCTTFEPDQTTCLVPISQAKAFPVGQCCQRSCLLSMVCIDIYMLELIWNIHISCMPYGVRYNKYHHPTGNSYNNLTPWRQKRWTLWKLIWWQCDIKSYYIMIMDMSMWRLTVLVHKTNVVVDRQHHILKIRDSATRRSFLL